jgi:hypothetical protein
VRWSSFQDLSKANRSAGCSFRNPEIFQHRASYKSKRGSVFLIVARPSFLI